jgi:alkylation response protein AidB-like acyl-CoA dehydrogenase
MALGISEEHQQLAESVAGWAERHCPPSAVRAVIDGSEPDKYRDKLRPALAEQGLFGLHLPEPAGGQGFGLPELIVAREELGRALLPGAFLPTVLASAVLAAAAEGAAAEGAAAEGAAAEGAAEAGAAGGDLARLLAGLADGSLTGAVSLARGMRAAGPDGAAGGLVIDGSCGPVLGAPGADVVILPAEVADGQTWAAVDAAGLEITPVESLDLTRPAGQVRASRLAVPASRVLATLPAGAVDLLAAALLGAEACGIAGWAVHTATEHATVRHQFGRPIGQFQAVKHRIAWMLTTAEQAAAAVWDAARAAGAAAPEREFAAAVAAALAPEAAVTCVHDCIQVLGGIGYTWEHDAHLYYRRALSLRAVLGPAAGWQERVAALALDGAGRPVEVDLPPDAEPLRESIRSELGTIASAPRDEQPRLLAGGGWVMPHLPRPWGRDAGPLEQIVTDQEMRTAGLRPPGLAIGAWVVPALVQYGTQQQQERFLPATLRGEILWCQLFSEPGAGSDLAGLSTRAEPAEGGWRLTGQKIWTSLAKDAAWAICLARTDPAAPRHDGITYFLVDMSSPGIEVRPLREMTGDALFNEVFLDGVFVPSDMVVGEVNGGWRVARTTLANERVSLSRSWTFGCGVPEMIGTARAAGLGADSPLLGQVGALTCEGHAIDLLGMRTTLRQLSGTEPGSGGSVRKLLGMRHAQRVAELCWAMGGPEGAVGGTQWSRAVLFSRALTIGGGTTDIQLNIIGERILGLPRDPGPPGH